VLNRVYEDVASGKDANRPELVAARHALASGLAGGLVVTRLDRLSRSIADFAGMLDEAAKGKWRRPAVCSPGWSSSSPLRCPRLGTKRRGNAAKAATPLVKGPNRSARSRSTDRVRCGPWRGVLLGLAGCLAVGAGW
jgi:hypothetical protein